MNGYLGDFATGATVYIPFHTFASAGNSVTLTGLAVTDIEVYKNGSATQRASDAGFTLLDTDGIDFDGITGIHGFKIDLSDNTDSGFYAAGSDYFVVVSAVTVDSQTVNFVACSFSIENRNVKVNVTSISGDSTAADNLEAMLDGTGGVKLSLSQLNIVAASNDSAIVATGSGSGHGILATGGATGDGMRTLGGATSGDGYHAEAQTSGDGFHVVGKAGPGMKITGEGSGSAGLSATGGTNGPGIDAAGAGTGSGILATGGATGHGASLVGGATSGNGLRATGTAGNSAAVNAIGQGSAAGILSTGGATGDGAKFDGGATSGSGLRATGSNGNANGATFTGQGSAAGFQITGGATGHGMIALGGATSGNGARFAAANSGDGASFVGATNGDGIDAAGAGTGSGVLSTGGATGHGVKGVGGATSGDGMNLTAPTAGDGLEAVGAGGGYDVNADVQGALSGAVGSVTGAVGSVTGSVGGNVTGSVGSVVGAVGSVTGAVGSVTGNVGGNVVGSVASVTAGVNATQINSSANAAARLALSAAQMIPGTVDNTAHTPTTTEFEADDITEATADHYNGRLILWTSGALVGQVTSVTDYVLTGGRGHFTCTALTEAAANNDTFILV